MAGTLAPQKRVALIAHDNKKPDLLDWARFNQSTLSRHVLFATGTTGDMLAKELEFMARDDRLGDVGDKVEILETAYQQSIIALKELCR